MVNSILVFLAFEVLCVFSNPFYEKGEWDQLKKSAHQIGFCVYNTDEQFCNEHINENFEQNRSDEQYFKMTEGWAKSRIVKLAESQAFPKEKYLLMFDIRQGYNPNKDEKFRMPLYGYVIINLSDSIKFEGRTLNEHLGRITVSSINGSGIFDCPMTREFVSGRGGRITDIILFDILTDTDEIHIKFKNFTDAFYQFKNGRKKL